MDNEQEPKPLELSETARKEIDTNTLVLQGHVPAYAYHVVFGYEYLVEKFGREHPDFQMLFNASIMSLCAEHGRR